LNPEVVLDSPEAVSNGGLYYIKELTPQGCENTVVANVVINSIPEVSFISNVQDFSILNPDVAFTNTSINSVNENWSFGDGASSQEQNPSHSYPTDFFGFYSVTLSIIDGNGCENSKTELIKMKEDLIYYIPNSFTPDGNIFNEVFQPVFSSGLDPLDYNLKIYNRWGQIVFESNDHLKGWDGRFGSNDQIVSDGVYTYEILYREKESEMRGVLIGSVNVLR
jgi:gliding motility-associated-like protein